MRFDKVIYLVAVTYQADSIGQQVEQPPARRKVYANEWSISSSERYEAGRNDLKPERRYQVRTSEYQGEQLMEVSGVEYTIIGVEPRGEWTLLTGERKVANG